MPRPATRTRILSLAAGATAGVVALSLLLSPPAEVDPFGTLGRANAAPQPAPEAAPASPPVAFGVPGIDLRALGYTGPDLERVTLGSLSKPFPDLPTERAADIRDRLTLAAPHLRGLHQAKILLGRAATKMDHHVYAAKVAAGDSLKLVDQAEQRLAEGLAEVAAREAERPPAPAPVVPAAPEDVGPGDVAELVDATERVDARLVATDPSPTAEPSPIAEPAEPGEPAEPAAVDPPARTAAARVADAVRIERLRVDVAQARAEADARWADLEARRARRAALQTAAAAAEHETWRVDAHVRWLEDVLWRSQRSMLSAGNWLVHEERGNGELPIVQVRGFYVHESIAGSVRQLVDAAAAVGIDLRGRGHRPAERQIELRRQNCGSTQYDIFEKPAGLCSPPTAKPGRSLHELGLALDFRNGENSITSRRDPAYQWLAANAPAYGLYNLPSEPWHWSVTSQ
jgi:hypothetical protein